MPVNNPKNLNFYWCTCFVRALYKQGIRHVVISPGSRSTPLTLAFAAHPGFKKTIIIDERSAAFTALGLAKFTGNPACLVCTSGTAVANYLPAAVEAKQSGVPMIIASADRPPHLRGIGASQTIDQINIFGNYAIFFHDMEEPNFDETNISRLEFVTSQAVSEAISKGGIAHINFPFDKPLEPTPGFLSTIEEKNKKLISEYTQAPFTNPPEKTVLDESIWKKITSSKKPVLIAGPSTPFAIKGSIISLAEKIQAPVLAEPGANLPKSELIIEGFDGFLRNKAQSAELKPDLILRFGMQPVSRALNDYLITNSEVTQLCFLPPALPADETKTGHLHLHVLSELNIPDIPKKDSKQWLDKWEKTETEFSDYRKNEIRKRKILTDGDIFSELSTWLPNDGFTMVSNSFSIRDMALFSPVNGKKIYVNRGASGIDGVTSTAIGLSISSQKPGVLFIGDIAFLHDTNALLNARYVEQPLVIVLINNGGGTIFRMLPINEHPSIMTDYFETPQQISIENLCGAYSLDHTLITDVSELMPIFNEKILQSGIHILECRTNAVESMNLRKALWNFPSPKN